MARMYKRTVAAIGIGSNSVRLLVAFPKPGGIIPRERLETVTRLGSYDSGKRGERLLKPQAINDTLAATRRFAAYAVQVGAGLVGVVATEAVRTAANRGELTALIEEAVGLPVTIISGEREAALGWLAVSFGHVERPGEPLLVIDVGGGSADLSEGAAGSDRPRSVTSLKVGGRTLTDRFGLDGAVGPAYLRSVLTTLSAELHPQVAGLPRLQPAPRQAIVIGGTASTLLEILWSAADDDFGEGDLLINRGWLAGKLEWFSGMEASERIRAGVPASRADVIVGGGAILLALLDAWGLHEFYASQRNILDGFLSWAHGG